MSDVDSKMFLDAETFFGLNFLSTLPANESLVFSPLSIALALSLVHSGAKGASKDQIGDALLKGASDDQFLSHFQLILKSLKDANKGVKVNVANRVYLKNGFTLLPTYLSTVSKNYNASAESLDFSAPSTVHKINNFVKEATEGKISNLVDQESIQGEVALLINAVYFKGDWYSPFESRCTVEKDFYSSGKTLKIPFMVEDRSYKDLAQDELFQVLVLKYEDQKYKFAIFLPKNKNLGDSLKKLNSGRFQKLLNAAERTYTNVEIPIFTVEKQLTLKKSLSKLGITEIFTDNADLSGMAQNVLISDGLHKAIIEVNEEGTTAAAATMGKVMVLSMIMDEPVDFKANHPFLFALVRENHPIFLGAFYG